MEQHTDWTECFMVTPALGGVGRSNLEQAAQQLSSPGLDGASLIGAATSRCGDFARFAKRGNTSSSSLLHSAKSSKAATDVCYTAMEEDVEDEEDLNLMSGKTNPKLPPGNPKRLLWKIAQLQVTKRHLAAANGAGKPTKMSDYERAIASYCAGESKGLIDFAFTWWDNLWY